jgi:putative FmdB family regulatory protein
MPIYGYRCSSCGHQFEILQKMSDESLKTCPKCQGKLDKIIYPTGIIYKGSGYYTTDYKASGRDGESSNGKAPSPESKPETKAESGSGSAPEKKAESKAESKPESKDSKSQKDS